jgi:hypothetical protein
VYPGQFVTSLESIKKSVGLGISTQNIRSALKRFEKLQFLTNKATKSGRVITLINWGDYQYKNNKVNKDANKEVTKTQQRGNKDLTPNNNDNNDKNIIYSDEFLTFWDLYPRKIDKKKSFILWKKIKPNISDCLSAIQVQKINRAELKRVGQFCAEWKHPTTWLNGECWLDEPIEIEPKSKKPGDF